MSEVTISVRGESERTTPPERATVTVTAEASGADRAQVMARVTALSAPLRDYLARAEERGAVERWSVGRMSAWTDSAPDGNSGGHSPVQHGTIDVRATFADFADFSEWTGSIAEVDGIRVGHIEWELTAATRREVEADAAREAVAAATARAEALAAALGLSSVDVVHLADLGLLGGDGAAQARTMKASFGSAPDASFRPEALTVRSGVEARFVAR